MEWLETQQETVEQVKTAKYSKAKKYSPAYWKALKEILRTMLKEQGTWAGIGEVLGTSPDAYRKFGTGRAQGLSESSLDVLRAKGIIPLEIEAIAETVTAQPVAEWQGETKIIREVSEEKGYSPATLRKYCKIGRLNYQKPGRNILVCLDEKYNVLPQTEICRLRKENASLQERLTQSAFPFAELENAQKEKNTLHSTIEKLEYQVELQKIEVEKVEQRLDEQKQDWLKLNVDLMHIVSEQKRRIADLESQLQEKQQQETNDLIEIEEIEEIEEVEETEESNDREWRVGRGKTGVCFRCLVERDTYEDEDGQEFCCDQCRAEGGKHEQG